MNLTRNGRVTAVLVAAIAALALVLSDAVGAGGPVAASLEPVRESQVGGSLSLAAAGRGNDRGADGVRPSSRAVAQTAAPCRHAHYAAERERYAATDLRADARGRARAVGRVLFHGREPVQLSAIADGAHVVVVVVRGRIVAYALILRS